MLFPKDPNECFSLGAEAFELAEKLQTPVIVMSDLDIGMNDWMTDPFAWDDTHVHDRGKVLDAEMLDKFKELKGRDWGRYQDVDGDAIPYRTLPGTHPTKGAFFTRGTSHDENARYTEDGHVHARVIDRHPPQVRYGGHVGAEARDQHPRQERQDRPHLFRRQYTGRARGAGRDSSARASRSMRCG